MRTFRKQRRAIAILLGSGVAAWSPVSAAKSHSKAGATQANPAYYTGPYLVSETVGNDLTGSGVTTNYVIQGHVSHVQDRPRPIWSGLSRRSSTAIRSAPPCSLSLQPFEPGTHLQRDYTVLPGSSSGCDAV